VNYEIARQWLFNLVKTYQPDKIFFVRRTANYQILFNVLLSCGWTEGKSLKATGEIYSDYKMTELLAPESAGDAQCLLNKKI